MYNKILLPIDLNHKQSWSKALPTALNFCQTYNASLHVIMVLPNFGMPMVGGFFPKEFAEKAKKTLTDNLREFVKENVPKEIKVQRIVADGKPYEAILKMAKKIDVDLIIMASHKRKRLEDYLLGTNALRVVQQSKRSVMIVR
ncbi:universal stress protein [Pseudomonas neustonica]|uniref:Universal stress protein n=1 Tax=Pseudomonas neustonica TaxID=2487346 RepID=A0ABX9XE77_9PSED|nr:MULTISPECIES: universal stress protein [Pseudomonas]MAB25130.1 universal stress protein UspA [Pseudomonadales bacterium]MBA6419970.1 universal stress protein [Pseudomonas sp. 5Ae-yellow]ROZ80561.1 universal stress protein [Pseudomonas sp. SSM44]ROZ81754.1 universal stress protein [Pseudomonas neustonica]|tara:strand:- start:11867 stop:12295 length:429 start_codon:yes stop_codon:yes gene_type:complete